MAWRANQNQDLIVNNLTINGKLTYADPDDAGIVIPTDFTCEQLESVDKTNKIDMSKANEIDLDTSKVIVKQLQSVDGTNKIVMSTANELDLNSTKVKVSNDLVVTGSVDATYYHAKGKTSLLSQAKTQGTYISWNDTNGGGETDIICSKGGGSGGFNFYIQDNNGSVAEGSTPLLKVNNSGMNLQGNLTVTGTVSSSNTSMQQEFHYLQIGGNASSVSSTVNITGNGSTNYAVFPSIYYGYHGSSGTYNANDTSGAVHSIVIANITSTHFDFHLEKSTGDNVNIFIVFMVVFASSLNYTKSY